jgi:ABC-2 type transport system permease protein
MHGITIAFLEDVWSRNFLNLFSTPLLLSEYLLGLVVSGILTSLIGLLVMIVLASALFGLSFLSYGILFIPFLLVLFGFGIALGILACAMVLRMGPSSEWFVWPIPMIVSPFVGVFYPLSTLPAWMHTLSYALPPSYMFEAMRALVSNGEVWILGLLIGGILAVIYIIGACVVFSWVYRNAVKSGLIARYSAESVS